MSRAAAIAWILVASTISLTMARAAGQTLDASDRAGRPLNERTLLSPAFDESAHGVRPDNDSMLPPSKPAYLSDSSLEHSQHAAPDQCGCPSCRCGPCPCPCYYGQVEAVFMQRVPRYGRQAIAVDAITGDTFLSTSDLDSDFSPGVRATFGMRICGGQALEFSYFGLFDDSSSAFADISDPAAFPTLPGNLFGNVFVDFDRLQVDYASSLNGFEANLVCCCGCCDEYCDPCGRRVVRCQSYEWFYGFRYFDVSEELNIAAERDIAGGVEEGNYRIRTTNHLYGMQLGGRVRRTQGRYGWEGTGKAGIFGNDARQRQSATDFPDFPLRPTVSSRGGNVAFVGEANLTALYRLTDVWNLRAGYSVIWIYGLALAPDQIDFDFASATGGNRLYNGGGLLLHGVNVGIEARW